MRKKTIKKEIIDIKTEVKEIQNKPTMKDQQRQSWFLKRLIKLTILIRLIKRGINSKNEKGDITTDATETIIVDKKVYSLTYLFKK